MRARLKRWYRNRRNLDRLEEERQARHQAEAAAARIPGIRAVDRTVLYGDSRPPGHRPIRGFKTSGRPLFKEDE